MTGQHFRLIRKLQTFRPFKARKILLDNYTVNMVLEKSTGLVQIASLVEISTKLVEISTSRPRELKHIINTWDDVT